ncbi:MAG: hypothetical protein WAK48_11745, partial [Candidatus Acidiferrum sp.]
HRNLAALAPSFDCAGKFLRLTGSIWHHSILPIFGWQVVSNSFAVHFCANLCKSETDQPTAGLGRP